MELLLSIRKISELLHNKSLLNGVLFAGFSFINQGFGFILLLILANYITPAEYGYLSLFNTVIMLLGYIMAMSSQGYFSVSYFKEKPFQVKETFSCILLITLAVSVILLLLLVVFGKLISTALNLPLNVLYIGVVLSFLSIFYNLNLDYLQVRTRVIYYGLLSCGYVFTNFVLSIILVKVFLMGWEGRVWAQFSCALAFGLSSLLYFYKNEYFVRPSTGQLKKMLFWGIPLIPHLSTNFIRQGCDRYIINSSHTIEDVGFFSFALTLSTIISMIGFGFNQANSVDIYKILGDKEKNNQEKSSHLKRMRHTYICLYSLSSLLVFLGCYYIMPLLLPKYSESMRYFPILAIYGFLLCIYLVYTNYLFYFNKTKNIMYITFGSALLHLCLSLLFTRYSLYITASLYVITQLIVVIAIRRQALRTLIQEIG